MPKKSPIPMSNKYCPEIDISPELNAIDAVYYQSLIGILQWMVKLGRVDITTEVSMLSSCLALPREGHLKQLSWMFSYLEKQNNSEMVLIMHSLMLIILNFQSKIRIRLCMQMREVR